MIGAVFFYDIGSYWNSIDLEAVLVEESKLPKKIHHLAVFISRLWQIHIFGEGNTRTTAVFFIKYLRTLGFSAANDILRKMHGILEMHLFVQTTRTCRWVFMKQQSIWKHFSEICF